MAMGTVHVVVELLGYVTEATTRVRSPACCSALGVSLASPRATTGLSERQDGRQRAALWGSGGVTLSQSPLGFGLAKPGYSLPYASVHRNRAKEFTAPEKKSEM